MRSGADRIAALDSYLMPYRVRLKKVSDALKQTHDWVFHNDRVAATGLRLDRGRERASLFTERDRLHMTCQPERTKAAMEKRLLRDLQKQEKHLRAWLEKAAA